MNAIIIYKSRYGATRQYAEWLGDSLHLPIADCNTIDARQLQNYDLVILGSSVYIGKLELSAWIKHHIDILTSKKLMLFIVCATPPDEIEKLNKIEADNIPDKIKPKCKLFYLHGKMCVEELSWKDRLLLKLGAHFVRDPEEKKHMLQNFDDVKKEHLQKLIEACKNLYTSSVTDQFID